MQAFTGSPTEWDELIGRLPSPHFLQTWEWAEVKSKFGWEPLPFVWEARSEEQNKTVAAAMILKRSVLRRGFAARLCVLYIPRGPVLDWSNESLRKMVLADLQEYARREGAIFLKVDPDVPLGTGIPSSENGSEDPGGMLVRSDLERAGWRFSQDQIQFRNTVLIELSRGEDELLSGMKPKTRYNIRLAEKKGVAVQIGQSSDLPLLYQMYAETSLRDGFAIRDENYYRTVWETFMNSAEPSAEPLIAQVDGQAVAALFLFYFARRAYYVYGMSRESQREKMPNYLLQWEAMRRAKGHGCSVYDLWGAPEKFDDTDHLWGVFRFKDGFGGGVVRTLGAWDYAPNPFWYAIYSEIIPRMLSGMRALGKNRLKQNFGGA